MGRGKIYIEKEEGGGAALSSKNATAAATTGNTKPIDLIYYQSAYATVHATRLRPSHPLRLGKFITNNKAHTAGGEHLLRADSRIYALGCGGKRTRLEFAQTRRFCFVFIFFEREKRLGRIRPRLTPWMPFKSIWNSFTNRRPCTLAAPQNSLG